MYFPSFLLSFLLLCFFTSSHAATLIELDGIDQQVSISSDQTSCDKLKLSQKTGQNEENLLETLKQQMEFTAQRLEMNQEDRDQMIVCAIVDEFECPLIESNSNVDTAIVNQLNNEDNNLDDNEDNNLDDTEDNNFDDNESNNLAEINAENDDFAPENNREIRAQRRKLRKKQLLEFVNVPSNLLDKERDELWFKNCPGQKQRLRDARFHRFSVKCHPWGDWVKKWPVVYHGTYPRNIPGILAKGFKVPDNKHTSHKHVFGDACYTTPDIVYARRYAHHTHIIPNSKESFQTVLECHIRPGSYTVHTGTYAHDLTGVEYVCPNPKGNIIISAVLFKKYGDLDRQESKKKKKK